MSQQGNRLTIDTRHRILFLAAEPTDQAQLTLEQEALAIEAEIRAASHRDQLDFRSKAGVTFDGLQRALLEYRPQVLHISGHGTSDGIYLVSKDGGDAELLDHAILTSLLSILNDDLQLVVLNACNSASYIDATVHVVPFAVGMPAQLPTDAATRFSAAFYRAIGYGRTVDEAFKLGRLELERMKLPDDMLPSLHRRESAAS